MTDHKPLLRAHLGLPQVTAPKPEEIEALAERLSAWHERPVFGEAAAALRAYAALLREREIGPCCEQQQWALVVEDAARQTVDAYDAYRRRGVAPAPVEYAEFARMVDSVLRAALAMSKREKAASAARLALAQMEGKT